MSTGIVSDPYATPLAVNENGGGVLNATGGTILRQPSPPHLAVFPNPIVSGSTEIFAETYNGAIPGPRSNSPSATP